MHQVVKKSKKFLFSEGSLCLLVLLAAAVIVAHPLLFQGRVPIGGAGLSGLPPWEGGQGAANPEASGASDLESARYYAAFRFLSDTVRNGDSLLWNPGQQAGVPFLAQWWTRCLSPFSLPFYLFGMQMAYAVSTFLKLLTAGWLAYYVVRVLGLSRAFALLVGLSQQLGGFLLLLLHHPVSDIMPWIPILFLYVERLSIGQGRYWPIGALIMGLMLLGGDPVATLATFLFFTCYFAARVWRRPNQVPLVVPVVSGFFAGLLALALAATQILPAFEWWSNSVPVDRSGGTLPNIAHLIGIVLPHWDGSDASTPRPERSLGLFFVGPVQLLLACLWVALRTYAPEAHRRRIDALLGISAATIFVTLLLATVSSNVPTMAQLYRPERLLPACHFALALGCAAAAEAWLQLKPAECVFALKRFITFALIALVCVGAALAIAPYANLSPAPEFAPQVIALGVISLIALALIGFTLLRPRARVLGYGLAAITAAQSYAIFAPMVSFASPGELYPETEFIQTLADVDSRIGGSPAIADWPLGVNGIATFYGPGDRALQGYLAFLAQLEKDPQRVRHTSSEALLLTRKDLQGPDRTLRPTLRMRSVFPSGVGLFECLDCGPAPHTAPRDTGATDTVYPAKLGRYSTPVIAARKRAIKTSYSPSAATLDTNTRLTTRLLGGEGTVTLAHAYYPGWRAFIDGHEENVFPVDGLFMGVRTPRASRSVVFSYEPHTVFWGRVISIVAGVLVLLGLGNLFYFRLHDTYFRS